jgi:hypothetical protein
MRKALLAVVAVCALAGSAHAGTEPAMQHSCIAVGSGLSRVAATVRRPQDCCTGRMQCSQYLSTTTVVRPDREQQHT